MLRSSKGLLVANSPGAEQALRLMVGKAWRLARTRRRRAAWAAEAVSVVWLAAVIAPATGGARWLTSPMMVTKVWTVHVLSECARGPADPLPLGRAVCRGVVCERSYLPVIYSVDNRSGTSSGQ